MREFAREFYRTKAWQAAREAAMSRDGRLCVDCLRKGMYTPAEEVHHVIPLTPDNINDPSISLALDNLVSLCRECHKARHHPEQPRYKVDEYGRVIIK
ncbi:MAG: HNH endonuclease [Prevotella sp.]|nr:HNH endonuclease [Prevotella sp.]MBR2096636.1 HNH endonuclease [Prevotella sp.]